MTIRGNQWYNITPLTLSSTLLVYNGESEERYIMTIGVMVYNGKSEEGYIMSIGVTVHNRES